MLATFKTDCHESFGNKCNQLESFDKENHYSKMKKNRKTQRFLALWFGSFQNQTDADWRMVLPLQDPVVASRAVAPEDWELGRTALYTNEWTPQCRFLCKVIVHLSVCLSIQDSLRKLQKNTTWISIRPRYDLGVCDSSYQTTNANKCLGLSIFRQGTVQYGTSDSIANQRIGSALASQVL